ncbi:MAG: MOSC domain-containing protein [Sulfitobacter sp.]
MTARVETLFHYPIKGLSAQKLDQVTLRPGEGFPLDRAFGFARPGSGFDPANPKPLPKGKFVVLARDAALARLQTFYDDQTGMLSIAIGTQTKRFACGNADGAEAAAAFIAEILDYSADMVPTLCTAAPHRFTDVSVVSSAMMNAISLINIDSVQHFSNTIGYPISADRFRGNILFSGMSAFSELDRIGDELRVGEAIVKLVRRTKRCPATEVNLETGERDLDVPKHLRDSYGHSDMGVYAEVVVGGAIQPGDVIEWR